MNITTRAILINSRSGNEVSSIRKVHLRCLTYVEKISNVSRYKLGQDLLYEGGRGERKREKKRRQQNLIPQSYVFHYEVILYLLLSACAVHEFTSIALYILVGLYCLSANLS